MKMKDLWMAYASASWVQMPIVQGEVVSSVSEKFVSRVNDVQSRGAVGARWR